jgi:hypothetical protein
LKYVFMQYDNISCEYYKVQGHMEEKIS